MEKKRKMKKRWVLDQAVRHTIEETWAVFTNGAITPNPALFLTRLADLARSNAFLWTEAGLSVQEHATRVVPVGQSLSRSLVLATVAADIFVGYTTLGERAKWVPSLVKPRDWELQHQRSANRVLETAISLGGALIKACQFASTRPDLLPAVYIRTLAPLQDRMPPRSWSEVERAITRELGRRPEDVFAHIEREAVAAASIAQVHRARLHDGREVAVKVQYPDIEDLVETDLAWLLNDLYADQMLHLGMLHADPHPGNLRVQPGPRLVLLDHGLTVPLAPGLVDSLKRMVQALTSGDFDGLSGALAEAGLRFEGE